MKDLRLVKEIYGSGVGSVKITYTSLRETDDVDTPLVDALVAIAMSESGEIKVEGRVKDGVLQLTKIGALDVVVSLEDNIILCTQADQPSIIRSVSSISDDDNVIISSMSFGRIERTNEAVMVIGVDEKPSKKALKKIDEICDLEEFVFIAL
ncbi:hypothetical protein Tco_0026160 [Tanacetum coccineum]